MYDCHHYFRPGHVSGPAPGTWSLNPASLCVYLPHFCHIGHPRFPPASYGLPFPADEGRDGRARVMRTSLPGGGGTLGPCACSAGLRLIYLYPHLGLHLGLTALPTPNQLGQVGWPPSRPNMVLLAKAKKTQTAMLAWDRLLPGASHSSPTVPTLTQISTARRAAMSSTGCTCRADSSV